MFRSPKIPTRLLTSHPETIMRASRGALSDASLKSISRITRWNAFLGFATAGAVTGGHLGAMVCGAISLGGVLGFVAYNQQPEILLKRAVSLASDIEKDEIVIELMKHSKNEIFSNSGKTISLLRQKQELKAPDALLTRCEMASDTMDRIDALFDCVLDETHREFFNSDEGRGIQSFVHNSKIALEDHKKKLDYVMRSIKNDLERNKLLQQ
jgi:hypothetical protein